MRCLLAICKYTPVTDPGFPIGGALTQIYHVFKKEKVDVIFFHSNVGISSISQFIQHLMISSTGDEFGSELDSHLFISL